MSTQINCDFCKAQDIKPKQYIDIQTRTCRRVYFHMCEKCSDERGFPSDDEKSMTILEELMEQLIEEVTERVNDS